MKSNNISIIYQCFPLASLQDTHTHTNTHTKVTETCRLASLSWVNVLLAILNIVCRADGRLSSQKWTNEHILCGDKIKWVRKISKILWKRNVEEPVQASTLLLKLQQYYISIGWVKNIDSSVHCNKFFPNSISIEILGWIDSENPLNRFRQAAVPHHPLSLAGRDAPRKHHRSCRGR